MANKIIFLNDVRMYWGDLFTKAQDRTDTQTGKLIPGTFTFTGIFAPDSAAGKTATAAIQEVAQQEFGANWQAAIESIPVNRKPVRKGDLNLDKDGNVKPGFEGMLYISAKNDMKPKVVDANPQIELHDGQGRPYRGCRVNAKIEISAYTSKKPGVGRCLSAKILAVQWVGDGEAFGSAPPTADGFDVVPGAETSSNDIF